MAEVLMWIAVAWYAAIGCLYGAFMIRRCFAQGHPGWAQAASIVTGAYIWPAILVPALIYMAISRK